MRFKIAGDYRVSVEEFWTEVFFVPGFIDALHRDGLKYDRFEVIEETLEDDGARSRILLAYPTLEIPRGLRAVLGKDIHYREQGTFDPKTKIWHSETALPRLGDKLQVKSQMYFTDTIEGHCVRTVEFDIQVRLFGIGRLLERFLKRTLTDAYEDARLFTNAWTDENMRAGRD